MKMIMNNKIHSLLCALYILENNIYLEYSTIVDSLIMIEEYYQEHNNKENALKYYIRANEFFLEMAIGNAPW